jgi:hypothetical protein
MTTMKLAHCPVFWCESLHEDGDRLHFGDGQEFVVLTSPLDNGWPTLRGVLSVSLEQLPHTGEVMVAVDPPGGVAVYLSRDDAKRLALALLRLDLDANGVDGA